MSETQGKPTASACQQCPAWSRSAFANLTPAALAKLELEKQPALFARSDAFSRKDQPAEEVYCLGAGSAKVTMTDAKTGKQSLVKLVAPGDMLGYRCIFSASAYRGTATALTPSHACKISKRFVFELIESDPRFAFEMLKRMGNEVAAAEYHHHSFCQKNVRERLAEALLILKEKFGVLTERGWRIQTRLTRSELANWIGASRETVIRTLADFLSERLIEQEAEELYVLELEILAREMGSVPMSLKAAGPFEQKTALQAQLS